MADTLEEILGTGKEEKTSEKPLEETPVVSEEQKKQDEEAQKKQEQLVNLNKAIEEANKTLKEKRKAIKKPVQEEEEEELPKIDMNDPSSKAWNKHIQDNVNPIQAELDKEKQEIRTFAFKQFLKDKPNLVSNPDNLKKIIETYDRIKTASERTVEGVLIDLDRAYASENYEELLSAAGQRASSKARAEEAFSDIAVSRGSTAYPTQRTSNPQLSEDDKAQLAKWGMSAEEYFKLKKKYG